MKRDVIHNFKSRLFHKKAINTIILAVLVAPYISIAASGTLQDPLGGKSFSDLIGAILDIMLIMGIPIAGLFFVYAGFTFVTSQGDPKKLDTAKSMFVWTCIGTGIIVGAKVIMEVLKATVESLK